MLSGAALHNEIEQMNLACMTNMARDLDSVESMLSVPYDELALFCKEVPGNRILDAGCGSGRYVSFFIDQGLEYVGVDYSKDMVEASRKRNPGKDFRVLGFDHLTDEFGKDAFDGLWACCVFSGLPKACLPDTLAQMYGVLRPGGTAVFIVPLSLKSDEGVFSTDFGPMYYTAWGIEEFRTHLEKTGFILQDFEIDFLHSSVSFLLKK